MRAVTAVSQALVERRGNWTDLAERYVFTLEASLAHGLREGMTGFFFGRTRLFDMFAAAAQAFPKAERDAAAGVIAEARFLGDTSLGRARILLRVLLNRALLPQWLSSVCYNLTVLARYYEPWALLRTPAAAALCAAVDAAARAGPLRLDIADARLNDADYWDAHPRIVALDVPLRAPAPAFTGKRLPVAVAPADTPHLAACQALLAARAALRAYGTVQHTARRAQALLRAKEPLFHTPARVTEEATFAQGLIRATAPLAPYPRLCSVSRTLQGCLRTARVLHSFDALVSATETLQGALSTRTVQQAYTMQQHAAEHVQALVLAARGAGGVRTALVRVQDAQGLLAARLPTPYGTACTAAQHAQALLRTEQQQNACASITEAAEGAQALVRADLAVRALRRAAYGATLVQAVARGNAHALMHLLRALATTWTQSGMATRRVHAEYARTVAAQHAQALLRGRRAHTGYVAAQQRLQQQHARQQAALQAALPPPVQQQHLQSQSQQQQQQQVLYAQPLTPTKSSSILSSSAGVGAGTGTPPPGTPAALASPGASPGKLRPQWVPDNASTVCMLCRRAFTMTNRKHHCRYCGILVDEQCTERRALPQLGYAKPVLVCRSCVVRHFT